MVAFTCRFGLSSKQLDRLNVYGNEQSYFCSFILYNKQLKDEKKTVLRFLTVVLFNH